MDMSDLTLLIQRSTATLLHTAQNIWLAHKKLLIGLTALVISAPIVLLIICSALVGPNQKYILQPNAATHVGVGLVLGAGISKNGKPFRELQARLDTAAQAIQDGQVDKLVLSGDNRFKNYNEPDVMRKYLLETKHIPAQKLQVDYAGRSTYESCERARKIFGIQKVTIFSAESHLPRAIFLCRHFGIQAYGISSGVEANNSQRREPLARVKAVYNIYIRGEQTVLGAPIQL